MRKLVLAALLALAAIAPALAQRQPAQMTTLPTSNPQEFDLLDKTGAWLPFGTAGGGVFSGLGGEISLRAFGAKCDGAADDTTALQAWLAKATTKTKLVGFPGQCVFKSALVIPAVDDLIVDFQGAWLRYQGANTTNDLVSIGSAASDCVAHRVLIRDVTLVSDTVMTGGAGFKEWMMCEFKVDRVYFGSLWLPSNNLYNGCHFWGGAQVYVTNYACRGSHISEIDNGEDAAHGGNQSTDMFHYDGVLSNGNIGLNIAGNCGGCQWDAVDIAGNHLNVLIDQSVAGIQNRQINFGSLFASDGTNGAPNNGIEIADPGNPSAGPGLGSEFFCHGCWISTSANDCLVVDSGVNWEIVLEGARIRNCGRYGINNASSQIHMVVNGGQLSNNGNTSLFNAAALPWVQILGRPSMFHGGGQNDISGLAPTLSGGCGANPVLVDDDTDYEFTIQWGTTTGQTSCTITFGASHAVRPTYANASVRGTTPIGVAVSNVTTTGEVLTFASSLPAGQVLSVTNSGLGF